MRELDTIDADTLMSTPLPATKFIIEGLLPEGLHILAGSPKTGKSWLALWMCLCVAKGEPVWGLPTSPGTVLYLCLEDSYIRIQSRLFQITDTAPDTLHFANLSNHIGDGLENQISLFLAKHPGTVLVVVDTLQRVRDIVPDSNSYANDYRELSSLKGLADKHHIAILLIHHLRKMNDADPMNMISGTTGFSGATDSNFVLKRKDRNRPRAGLHCTGRDIESRVLEHESGEAVSPSTLSKNCKVRRGPGEIRDSCLLQPDQRRPPFTRRLYTVCDSSDGNDVENECRISCHIRHSAPCPTT